MIQRRAPRWLFGWTGQFSDNWGTLPAVPVLYTAMLLGTLQITLTRRGTVTGEIHTPIWVSDVWRASSLISPALVALAWYLVVNKPGKPRLIGLWLRFGGDVGQAVALSVFLLIRLHYAPIDDDAHIFLMYIVGGVFFLVCMLVVRDIWILGLVQEIAAHLERLNEAGIET